MQVKIWSYSQNFRGKSFLRPWRRREDAAEICHILIENIPYWKNTVIFLPVFCGLTAMPVFLT